MRVLLTGASSQLGAASRRRLAGRGDAVDALTRGVPPPARAGVSWHRAVLPFVPMAGPWDAIVSFGPMDALAEWLASCDSAPAPVLVATSSMSAASKIDSPVAAERAVAARLQAGEAALVRECGRLGMGWTLLRPTMIYGEGLDRYLTPMARRARRWHVLPYPPGRGLRQPVHADDVAAIALAAAVAPANGVFEVGGGERLPMHAMFERVRRSVGRPVVPLRVPAVCWPLAARLVPAVRGALARADADLVADNGAVVAAYGIRPRAFEPRPSTWVTGVATDAR